MNEMHLLPLIEVSIARSLSCTGTTGMRIKFKSSNYFLNFSSASNDLECQRVFWFWLWFGFIFLSIFILFFLSLFTGSNCVISN